MMYAKFGDERSQIRRYLVARIFANNSCTPCSASKTPSEYVVEWIRIIEKEVVRCCL